MKIEDVLPRLLNVTRIYEGGTITWDFDGAGLSIGTLQWNIGTKTLQPMLSEMVSKYPDAMSSVFGFQYSQLKTMLSQDQSSQMAWVKNINDYQKKCIKEPWNSMFKSLIETKEWKDVEIECIKGKYLQTAINDTKWSGIKTIRSLSMFFDMSVQNGGMGLILKAALTLAKPILATLSSELNKTQQQKDKDWLIACAGTRALLAYTKMPQFAMNVFKRKLGIIEGGYNWRAGELPQMNEQINFSSANYGITDELVDDL